MSPLFEQAPIYFSFDPLFFIQDCVQKRRIVWTYHVNMRLKARYIPREWILESVSAYDLIEHYPEDKYMPSYLIWSSFRDVVFHVLFATDIDNGNVRVVTAYRPDPDLWAACMKQRRRK